MSYGAWFFIVAAYIYSLEDFCFVELIQQNQSLNLAKQLSLDFHFQGSYPTIVG